ncbi:probable G-protein coupled receptor 160 [Conger conger]|uniref:probable G-protein coupled receptor 160 n=1 Tax=Conger conger TaxID=82655 RepID=UPI002A5AF8E9|nr:probable G-protein coupled receptor 160 [Conger conger]
MDIPMPSLLLALGGKTLLNWAAVFVQRRHMCRSFLGTFCMSLAVADTLLFLSVSAIFLLGDVRVLGLRVTRHHVCALVHMACLAYSLLHWPVLLLAGLDYWRTLPPRPRPPGWVCRYGYPLAAFLVWTAVLLRVLGGPAPGLDPEPGAHLLPWRCRVYRGPQSTQMCTAVLFLLVVGALLCCCVKLADFVGARSHSAALDRVWLAIYRSLASFLGGWHAFVVLLVALLLLRVEVPGFLDMNVPWLCFLNSFLIGTVSVGCPRDRDRVIPAFPDGFCDWSSLGAEPPEVDTDSLECKHCLQDMDR